MTMKTLLAGVAFVASAAGANAATFVADSVISATRGTCTGTVSQCASNGRLNADNAVDGNLNTFYALGFGGAIDLGFTNLMTAASNTITAFEVTFQPQGNHLEAADVFALLNGVESFVGRIFNTTTSTGSVHASSVFTTQQFDAVRLVDVTREVYGFTTTSFDGFDVAQVSVAAVPLPAAGLMLMAGLGGFAALRRRKTKAA